MSFHSGNAAIILEDGHILWGEPFGAQADVEGEVVFTTSMTGYQEVATDPSFRGQIVCMTYPLIGNYGCNLEDDQSRRPWISAMIVREYCPHPNHWRARESFGDYLERHGIPGISGVDTRALTKHIRRQGAMRGLLCSDVRQRGAEELVERARRAWSPSDANVVADVSIPESAVYGSGDVHVVLIDCGVKQHIIESLTRRGVRVTAVPFDTPYERIAALAPDGVLTSPGPGDPENAGAAISAVRGVIDAGTPYFGVCLGHQLLGLAVGATTSKLKFGHRGGNHPVLDLESNRVYITSQNHGYQIDIASVPEDNGWRVSKINLNDGSVEGISHATLPVVTVQYHPEGSPGPQDSQYLFDEFVELVRSAKRSRQTVEVAL